MWNELFKGSLCAHRIVLQISHEQLCVTVQKVMQIYGNDYILCVSVSEMSVCTRV